MAKKIIKAQMKQRLDTKANWAAQNPVLLAGELGIVSDDPNLYKVGDGTTAWNGLPFRGFDGTLVHTTGDSETAAMSQKGVTEELAKLSAEVGYKEESKSYIRAITDADGKFLCGIKEDGSIDWAIGVPQPIVDYIEERLGGGSIPDVFILQESEEFISAEIDADGGILSATTKEGKKVVPSLEVDTIQLNKDIKLNEVSLKNIKEKLEIPSLLLDVTPPPTDHYSDEVSTYDKTNVVLPEFANDGNCTIIHIASQEQFNDVKSSINKAIINGYTNIVISLEKEGLLFFDESHIDLTSSNYSNSANVRLNITATPNCKLIADGQHFNGQTIVGCEDGRLCHNIEKDFSENYLFANNEGQELLSETPIRFANSEVEIVNADTKLFKIKLSEIDRNIVATHIFFTSWFQIFTFPISKIEEGYAYFYAPNATYDATYYGWTVNRDISYGNTFPRYQLMNVNVGDFYVKDGKLYSVPHLKEFHISTKTRFAFANGSAFKSICFQNLTFVGNADAQNNNALIDLQGCSLDYVLIENCNFINIKSRCINAIGGSKNVYVKGCKALDCYERLIYSSYDADTICATNNYIDCSNRLVRRYSGIELTGQNSLIAENECKNVPYVGIRSGVWYENANSQYSEVVIEKNKIWQDEQYSSEIWKHALMDGGAIYVGAHCDKVIVRDNIILNINGMAANRGIFFDAYAFNVACYRNMVINTHNSIDIELYKGANQAPYNTNNYMGLNVITTGYMFQELLNDDSCKKSPNILIASSEGIVPYTLMDVKASDDDYIVPKSDVLSTSVRVPREYYKNILSMKVSSLIKSVLSLKN